MKVVGFDHLVLNVADTDRALDFYGNTLGLEVLRLEEFKAGDAPFPSVRVSPEVLIDLVQGPRASGGTNVDHFCLLVEPTALEGLAVELEVKGVLMGRGPGRRWGAKGWGLSFYIQDPDGNTIELKCHPAGYD